ncbi:FhaA domain-containing protein [uncultured Rothia sp.]|uniref:FhaA domain-containing protein n=1 Tax=uncultured Rothia sp. TaxID=316088 RepID=UPI0028F12E02|nr:FhaA domain-containing protein [uncultured Rothia sp.]
MKFFDKLGKLEQGIGRTVGLSKGFGTFAKADVANRVRIMMDDESYVDGSGRTMAPNVYTLRFAPVDFPRVREWGNPFAVELCDLAISHARAQGYTLIGAVRVTFNVLDSLSEGEFEVVATFEPFSVPEAPASPSLRGAANYAPVRPPRESSLPTRITKPAAQPTPPVQPAQPIQPAPQQAPAPRLNMPVPSPAAGAPRFFLEIEGRMHPVDRLPFVLGRGSDADFRLDDKGVSRRHLQLSMQGGAVVASDMGSTNGTLINGVPLRAPVVLANGSLLRMGNTRIIFHSSTGGAR